MLFETKGDHWSDYRHRELFDLTWAMAEFHGWATNEGIEREYVGLALNVFKAADRLKEYFYHRHQKKQEMTGDVIIFVGKFSYRKSLSIPCLGYSDGRGDYDCEYGSGITCEECICNGGNKDPREED